MNPRDFEPTLRASPSPTPPGPPQRVDPQTLAVLVLLGGAAVGGAALLMPETWGAYYALRLWLPLWVIGCLLFGGALLEQRSRWVTRMTRVSRHQLVDWGGGAYGAIALCCFLWLEWGQVRELMEWVVSTDWSAIHLDFRAFVREGVRSVVGFFVGSFMSGMYAFVWPAFWSKTFSAGHMAPAAVVGWGVFESARWAVKQVAVAAPPRPGTDR